MIEVELQQREASHIAIGHEDGVGWFGRRGRFWDMPCIEEISREQREVLMSALTELMEIFERHYRVRFTELIKDFEVCGSYAYGIENWWSDMDIQLSTEDERAQETITQAIRGDLPFLHKEVAKMSARLKLEIDIGYSQHNNKEYNEVYSLRDEKLYNREPGVPLSPLYKRRYNVDTKRYEVEMRERASEAISDHWAENGDERLRDER